MVGIFFTGHFFRQIEKFIGYLVNRKYFDDFFHDLSSISAASSAVKKLKTLRHPSVILYIDSHESEKAALLATEPVEPLLMHLNKDAGSNQQDAYLAWGMLQVFRGVAFLHEANLIHGSLHAGSVFVTPAGE